jgi:acyl-CoA thioester hydrolase
MHNPATIGNNDFFWPIRVYLEDTDAGGIVFYANYLKFFERARTEFVRQAGFSMRSKLAEGLSFVVHSLEMSYKSSAFLDDELLVGVEVEVLRKTNFTVRQWLVRKSEPETVLAEGRITVACVKLENGKPNKMPDDLQNALSGNFDSRGK